MMRGQPRQAAMSLVQPLLVACSVLTLLAGASQGQTPEPQQRGALAGKPLFRDPVFDGAADPAIVWNFDERKWYMFYTNRRAKLPDKEIDGVNWVHATKIGVAHSTDGAQWKYAGTANITYGGDDVTFWAPDVVFGNGAYHMFLTVVPGIFRDWNHPRSIIHLTSQDLKTWKYESTLELSSGRVIDASVVRLAEGGWRMWYNNEADGKSIYYADSDDLHHWRDRGKVRLPDFSRGEGPKVFLWNDWYWMLVDVWDGLAVYRSRDALDWAPQANRLLQTPGHGADDGVVGQHADVVTTLDRAYLFYFTHPGRTPAAKKDGKDDKEGYQQRRSSIQVAELRFENGMLNCDRDAPVYIDLRFRRPPQIHDPSTILKRNGRYWCFSTGMGVQALCSSDLSRWHLAPPVFERPPDWVQQVVPGHRGYFWAPDVIEWKGRYLLYYSVSAFGKRTSAIALASSSALDPAAKDYAWTDHGLVIQTDEGDDFNAIDPGVIATPDGELWLVFGSFWSGIKLIQLDPQTGKRLSPNSPMHSLAHKEQIEAPAIYFHDGLYYLFLNWGHCCRGVRSTYNIRVGRSRSITGPYLDRDGADMLEGDGTLVLESQGSAIGPGHAGVFEHDGQLMLSYHYYARDRRGQPRLGISQLRWDDQGWPAIDAGLVYSGSVVQAE